MDDFKFPTNIKQIGSIESGLRIYVEDYVCSYLQQYTSAADYDERLAILVGKYITIDKQPIIFISGAILGKYCILEKDMMIFSEKSYDYILEQIEKYFKGYEIVGWMQSQPGYGVSLNNKYENYHIENFRKPYQVLFVMDPIEKLSSFYIYNDKKDKLLETRGYFVYYEKNNSMHEYMLENRIVKNKNCNNIVNMEHKDKINYNFDENKSYNLENRNNINYDNRKDIDNKKFNNILFEGNSKLDEYKEDLEEKNINISKKINKNAYFINREKDSFIEKEKNNKNDQKRIVNMLVSMCGVMFLICFVLGTSLIRSEDRITGLEKEIDSLVSAYNNVYLTLQNTQEAFASKNDSITKKETKKQINKETNKKIKDKKEIEKIENKNKEDQDNIEKEIEEEREIEKKEENKEKLDKETKKELTNNKKEQNKEISKKTDKEKTKEEKRNIPDTYKVQAGDNLTKISIKFYGNKNMVKKIMKENNLSDSDKIFYGKVLVLPKQ